MANKQYEPNNESIIQVSLTPPGSKYDFSSSPHPLLQHPKRQTSESSKKLTLADIVSVVKPWWNTILVTSCVIAVLFDPLFFYIPIINEEDKCMHKDTSVLTAALVLRSVTDITFVVHIIYQLREAITYAALQVSKDKSEVNKDLQYESVSWSSMIHFVKLCSQKLSWNSFITDVLAVLPIPQALVLGVFFEIGSGDGFLLKRKVVAGFLLVQFLPRIYRIYLSSAAVAQSALWVKGVFNFFLYILASHILGAFWYFFALQRETSCWYRTCIAVAAEFPQRKKSECNFYCGPANAAIMKNGFNATAFKDILNEQCILKVPYNMTDPPFDFGIFFDALKNDIQGPINFPKKIGYCFWWGLRNLSNFGTSLVTSTHLWENTFAIVISITGLLLFLYLIGNVQIYMQRATTRSEEVKEKLQKKRNDIERWMENNGLEKDMRKEIMKNIKQILEEDITVDLEDIVSILPWYTKKALKRVLCMDTLRKVPMLRQADEKLLKMMCDYMIPVIYKDQTMVYKTGELIDRMVFITEGSMCTYKIAAESRKTSEALATAQSMETEYLSKGDYYGEMLLQCASTDFKELPTSTANVKCHTKVEAFVLMVKDLKKVVAKCKEYWPSDYDPSKNEAADQVAPLGEFQQQPLPKQRVAKSNVNPPDHKG